MSHASIIETLSFVLFRQSPETPHESPKVAQFSQESSQSDNAECFPEGIDDSTEDGDDLVAKEGRKRDDEHDGYRDDPTPFDRVDLFGDGCEPVDDLAMVDCKEGTSYDEEDQADVVVPVLPSDKGAPVAEIFHDGFFDGRALLVEVLWEGRRNSAFFFTEVFPFQGLLRIIEGGRGWFGRWTTSRGAAWCATW